jgi:GNAT superfamily N-acetyltransferase
MSTISLQVWADAQPDTATQKIISEGLDRYNESQVGPDAARPLWLVARNEKAEVIGGLKGVVLWSWLLVDWLWVADQARGQGVGSRLLSEAEDAAIEIGCSNAFLNTFTFQAPGFYRKQGYEIFGQLEDFPAGESRLWMRKRLTR